MSEMGPGIVVENGRPSGQVGGPGPVFAPLSLIANTVGIQP